MSGAAEWSRASAERCQVQVLESGHNVESRLLTTVKEASAEIEGLTPGARVKGRAVAASRADIAARYPCLIPFPDETRLNPSKTPPLPIPAQ